MAASGSARRGNDRRQFWIAGALLSVVLVGLIVLSAVAFSGPAEEDVASTGQGQGEARPDIIPRPGEGQAPKSANDRGGSEQLFVLGLMVSGVGCVALLVWRSSRRARAARTNAVASVRRAPPSPGRSP